MMPDFRIATAGAVLLLGMALLAIAGVSPGLTKPRSPLQVAILTVQDAKTQTNTGGYDIVEMQVKITALIDLKNIDIIITASHGAEIVSGDHSWIGDIKKDDRTILTITVRTARDGSGRITAKAVSVISKENVYKAEESYEFVKSTDRTQPRTGAKTKNSRDRDIIEYEIK